MGYDEKGFYHLEPKSYTTRKQLDALSKKNRKKIIFRHGHIAICDYHMGDNREFEKSLSTFDEIRWEYQLVGGYYIKSLKEFRINRGYNVYKLKDFFPDYHFELDNEAYPYKDSDVKLTSSPRDDFQVVALTFMASEGKYESNKKFTQQMIEAKTGSGKTFLSIAASCFWNARAIIICPFEKLLKQWVDSILTFTDATESQIMVVQGSKACEKIRKKECRNIRYFIFMVDTLVSYQKHNGDLRTIEMLRQTKCFVKIVDEVHRDIKAISMIDALSNFRMNYYLSASPGRADRKENWIFHTLFYNVPRFGANFVHEGEKYLNVIIKEYKFSPNQRQLNKMINRRKQWLNVKAYETELINASPDQRSSFDHALLEMLRWAKKQKKDDTKILILTSTIDGTEYVQRLAEQVFPGETSRYYGTMASKEEKKTALDQMVICATDSSLGTGSDIPRLQFVFCCVTYTAWTQIIQMSGRLRRLPDVPCVYCELVNLSWNKTRRQYEKRIPYLQKQSRTGKLVMIHE